MCVCVYVFVCGGWVGRGVGVGGWVWSGVREWVGAVGAVGDQPGDAGDDFDVAVGPKRELCYGRWQGRGVAGVGVTGQQPASRSSVWGCGREGVRGCLVPSAYP